MGILHAWGKLHDNANCFASGADFASTNVIDTLSAAADIGEGMPVKLQVTLTAAVTGGTSIQAILVDCDTEGGSYLDVLSGKVVLVAAALAGKVLMDIILPKGLQRFVRVAFRNVGANSAGKADANAIAGR